MLLSKRKSLNNWIVVGENKDNEKVEFLIDYPSVDQEQKLQSIQFGEEYKGNDLALKYAQYFLKFVIKNWKNVKYNDGTNIECKVINNELEYEMWWDLVKDPERALNLFTQLQGELVFTENDKKK